MVTIRPVRRQDVRPLIGLEVAPEDAAFVAPNAVTLAQAPYETGAHVFAICSNDTLVGLVAVVDNREYKYSGPDDDPQSAFLWRLMIAREHQRQGLGRAAMHKVFDWVREQGLPRLFTSVVDGNTAASRFYESLGFAFTGRSIDGEAEMRLELAQAKA
jgi:diamine N-acetyltransferase